MRTVLLLLCWLLIVPAVVLTLSNQLSLRRRRQGLFSIHVMKLPEGLNGR